MIFKNDFKEIAKNYQYFIFDVWGVIHDGEQAYQNACETVLWLKKQGKKICFLSNAPRRSFKVENVLEKYGIKKDLFDFVMTSGEAFYNDFNKNNFGKKYLYIGPKKDMDLLDGLDCEMVNCAKDADFAIATGFDNDNSVIEEKLSQIKDAISCNLKLFCINPDLMVIRKNGQEMLCAGVIAKKYQELLGEVFYYGKPYKSVYDSVFLMMDKNIDKNQVLAIGDGLETDIKGANNYGIKSVLITNGILSNKLNTKYGEMADENKVLYYANLENAFPDYVIPNL